MEYQKKKKSRMVFDEIRQEYRPRFGYNKPLDPTQDWVMEDNPNDLQKYGAEDPFEMQRMLKNKKNEKTAKHQQANKKRALGKPGQTKQVTLELHNNERLQKDVLERAVAIAQKSTASMGKFDRRLTKLNEKKVKSKPEYIPDDREERKRVESRIAERVIKSSEEVIDANKAANQMTTEEQIKNKKRRKS